MTEIVKGLHWIKLPLTMDDITLEYINVYLIRGKEGYLLVDAGFNDDTTFSTLHNYLVKHNLTFSDITQIVVTHAHPDHFGMAGRIKKLSGATLAIHNREAGFIETRYVHMEKLLEQTGRMLEDNGVPREELVKLRDASLKIVPLVVPTQPDISLHEGDMIQTGEFTFRVIWTPGHSSGHICLYEPDSKILLSGDHILPKITPNVSVHPQSIENPLGRYLKALREIRRLDIMHTLPGHNEPFDDPTARIDAIIEHHVQRNLEILYALQQGPRNTYQIARELTWGSGSRFYDLPEFHQRMAIFETLAHLEMLTAEGNLDLLPGKGVKYYRPR
jgi:glyoxylase-like metal-dependent hydrolase (beta-lactamase superfamily II)